MRTNSHFLASNYPELYSWALDKVAPLAIASEEIPRGPRRDPYLILTTAPYAELSALKGIQPPPPPSSPAPAGKDDDEAPQTDGSN